MPNVGEDDQYEAAIRDAKHTLEATGGLIGSHVDTGEITDPTSIAFLTRLAPEGKPTTACPHAVKGPRRLWVTSMRPGHGLCDDCAAKPQHIRQLAAHIATNLECDACGREPDDSQDFHEYLIQSGPIIYTGHVCGPCRRAADT